MSDRTTRFAGLYAVIAAGVAVLLAPLLALSYFATADGAGVLETGTVSAWADPARDLAGGLLTWAAPERVYATYVQVFALLFPAVFFCARAVRARRRPAASGRLERWGWRIALFGYGLLSVGLLVASVALVDSSAAVEGSAAYGALDAAFIALMLPGMAISVIGSTVLGIALLRERYESRLAASLLALAFPSMLVVSTLLGHNSLGMLPLFVGWAVAGVRLRRAGEHTPAESVQPAGTAIAERGVSVGVEVAEPGKRSRFRAA